MQTVGELIRVARVRRGWTQEDLARATRLSVTAIGSMERGDSNPRDASLYAIATVLGFNSWDELEDKYQDRPKVKFSTRPAKDVPVFSEVPAGNGDFDPTDLGEDNGFSSIRFPRLPGMDDPDIYGVIVKGNSMEPDYYSGDMVFCSPQAAHTSPMTAVFRLADGDCGVKIIESVGSDELMLIPRNKNHETRRVKRSEVLRLARVVGYYRNKPVPIIENDI